MAHFIVTEAARIGSVFLALDGAEGSVNVAFGFPLIVDVVVMKAVVFRVIIGTLESVETLQSRGALVTFNHRGLAR